MKVTFNRKIAASALVGSVMLLSAVPSLAADTTYQLSSHILDISTGKPAPDVNVRLMQQQSNGSWKLIDSKKTGNDGRIPDFLPNEDSSGHNGVYKLIFETTPYFYNQGIKSFYPYVEVNFNIEGTQHYHVPITLSPYGYSTYRGS